MDKRVKKTLVRSSGFFQVNISVKVFMIPYYKSLLKKGKPRKLVCGNPFHADRVFQGIYQGDFADADFPVQRPLVKVHIFLLDIHRNFIFQYGIIGKSLGNTI